MKIAWSVKVPGGSKLKVKNGESVKEGDLIYQFHNVKTDRLPLVGWQNLGGNDRKKILHEILKKELTIGEILWKGPWYANIIIKSPGVGKCMGVDEFGNIELETESEKKYFAPISAKRIKVEEFKIIFEFKGIEFEGVGITQLKSWGDFNPEIVNNIDQLSAFHKGKSVVVEKSLEAAVKAEAIGVAGLILVDIPKTKDFEECDIPVLSMEKSEATKLMKAGDGKKCKLWSNASTSKVLLVLE